MSAPTQQQIGAAFDACHKKVVWTYETIVATDFLPRFSAEATLDRVAPGALHAYQRGTSPTSQLPPRDGVKTFLYSCKPGLGEDAVIHIPHEFTVAAFRLGHTLVRDSYVLHDPVLDVNGNLLTGQPRPIFASANDPETVGLVGDNPVQPGDVIDWSHFYDVYGVDQKDESAQPGRPVDTLISDKLFNLPIAALPPGPDANGKDTSTERNLPRRNLMRASEPTGLITGSVGLATGEEMEAYAQQRIPGLHDSTQRGSQGPCGPAAERRLRPEPAGAAHPALAVHPGGGGEHSGQPAFGRVGQPHHRRIPARLVALRPGVGSLCRRKRPARLGSDRDDRAEWALLDARADRVSAGRTRRSTASRSGCSATRPLFRRRPARALPRPGGGR